jgi:hypothetical protein
MEGMVRERTEPLEADAGIRIAWGVRVGMDDNADPLQQTGVLQGLATPQHGVVNDGVVLAQEPRG